MNILAVDVGNSRVGLAAVLEGKLVATEHLAVADLATELAAAVARLTGELSVQPAPRAVISSVNPPAAEQVVAAIAAVVDWPVLWIGRDVALPLKLVVDNPDTVGVDRVLACAAAFEAVGGPVVVACFGTALTINAVDAEGQFLGGVICPGLGLSARVLKEATFALPEVAATVPESPFAKSTAAAIGAGLYYMAGGTLREVVERMADLFGQWPHLVLTGGDAELIATSYEFVDSVVPDLVLRGVNVAYRVHVARTGKR